MKFLVAVVVILLLILALRHRRAVVRRRRQRYYEPVRVFKPGVDPFDPNERIEFYVRKERDPE